MNGNITEVTVTNPGSGYSTATTGFFSTRLEIDDPLIRTLWTNFNILDEATDFFEPTGFVRLPVVNGLYVVGLGDTGIQFMRALPSSILPTEGGRIFLRAWFNDQQNGFQQLSPDTEIQAVPFALDAQRAVSALTAVEAQSAVTVAAGGVTELASINGDSSVAATVTSSGELRSYGDLFVGSRFFGFLGRPDSTLTLGGSSNWSLSTDTRTAPGPGGLSLDLTSLQIGTRGSPSITLNDNRSARFHEETFFTGDATFDSAVISDDYQLSTPVKKTLRVPLGVFFPENNNEQFRRSGAAVSLTDPDSNSMDSATFIKDIQLPHGAQITKVGVRFFDNDPFSAFSSMRVRLSGASLIAEASEEDPTTPSQQTINREDVNTTNISGGVVDSNLSYLLRVDWSVIFSSGNDALIVDEAYIEYTIDSLNP